MTTVFITLLIIAGFISLAIEFFLVPGFSVPGIAGIAMIGYGVYKAGAVYGFPGAFAALVGSAVLAVVLVRIVLKTGTVKAIGLDYNEKGATSARDYSPIVGKQGKALSDLRPSGIIVIEGKRYDVVTDGEYIEADSDVIVNKVEGARIIVSTVKK